MRHTDAGYQDALDRAREYGLDLPTLRARLQLIVLANSMLSSCSAGLFNADRVALYARI
jgi:hypothetical protein